MTAVTRDRVTFSGHESQHHKPHIIVPLCVWVAGVLDDEDVLTMMQGSNMTKVRSQRWQKSRSLRLLEDGVTVFVESTKSSRKAKAQQTCK